VLPSPKHTGIRALAEATTAASRARLAAQAPSDALLYGALAAGGAALASFGPREQDVGVDCGTRQYTEETFASMGHGWEQAFSQRLAFEQRLHPAGTQAAAAAEQEVTHARQQTLGFAFQQHAMQLWRAQITTMPAGAAALAAAPTLENLAVPSHALCWDLEGS
jgi:hypothetical protein